MGHIYFGYAMGQTVYWVTGRMASNFVMDDFGSLTSFDFVYRPHFDSLHDYDDAAWRAYWPAEMLPPEPKPLRTISPAAARELRRIESKLEAWELQHLRSLCAEQAERIEDLEQNLSSALRCAEMWSDMAREAQDALHAQGLGAMGITRQGQAVFVPAPLAWHPA